MLCVRRLARRFSSTPKRAVKDDEVGAKRRDPYSNDVFVVTDDNLSWSYEEKLTRGNQPGTIASVGSKILSAGASVAQPKARKLPALPPSLKKDISRSDLLALLNGKVGAQTMSASQ